MSMIDDDLLYEMDNKHKKGRKMAKKKVVEAEIVEETPVGKINIQSIQEKIIGLNDEVDNITTQALSTATSSNLTEYQDILIEAIMAIQEATGDTENVEDNGFWKKLGNRFGFVKKIQKTAQEKFLENASIQDNIDKIFDNVEGAIQATEKDAGSLALLQESLSSSAKLGSDLVEEISELLAGLSIEDSDMIQRSTLEGLLRELKSINLVNINTASQIKAQLTITTTSAQNLREVRPILKNLTKAQALVALQNARMGQANDVKELVSGVVNNFVIRNNKATQATILDAIEYSGKTIIRQETVAELGAQHDAFVKQLANIATDLNRQKLEYDRTVDKVTKQLGEGLKELPRLMSGDVSSTNSNQIIYKTKTTGKAK